MEHGLITAILLFLGAVGFAALILWMFERGGLLRTIMGAGMVSVIAVFGLALGWIIYHADLQADRLFTVWMFFVLFLVVQMLARIGWKWLIDPRTGIENKHADVQFPGP
jgi:hypothetical protein